MAEWIMRDLLEKHGHSDNIAVASAATSSEELGNPIYPPALQELHRHGIYPGKHAARRLVEDDYKKFDLLIGMDRRNVNNMRLLFGGDPEYKLKRLLDYTDAPGDISDPWYSLDFQTAWKEIYRGCTALLRIINEKGEVE